MKDIHCTETKRSDLEQYSVLTYSKRFKLCAVTTALKIVCTGIWVCLNSQKTSQVFLS